MTAGPAGSSRGRPILGAIMGLLFGVFLTIDLLFLSVFALDSVMVLLLPPLPLLQPATSNENETPARTTSVARPILAGTNRWVIDGNMMLRGIAVLTHFK